MDNYIVSARKYRPTTFDSVVGQRALTTTLKNAIATGKLAHAYLFCGPRGVGKTTCARIFAKTINCLQPTESGEACNECESCKAFNEHRSYNIHELDAASNNSVDDIRQLVEQVRVPPQIGKYQVYIIDEVHMLSNAAFNAFLKTLEEPPRHAIFILATTEKHKVIPTILSRCQIYDFHRIEPEDAVAHLAYVASKEGITAEPEALNVIALKADGGMRDALSIFDQVVSFTGGHITYQQVIENLNVLDYEYYFRLTDHLLSNRVSDSLLLLNEILNRGFDAEEFVDGLASHFRDLLVSKDAVTLPLLKVGASIRQRYGEQAQQAPIQFLYRAIKLCNDCSAGYRLSRNKRLLVELTLIQLAQLTAPVADADPAGRSPQQVIKPVFTQAAATPQAPAQAAPQAVSPQPAPSSPQPAPPTPPPFSATSPVEAHKPPVVHRSVPGISIKQGIAKEGADEAKPTETVTTAVMEEEAFTEKDVNFQWHAYAAQLPHEQVALQKRMEIQRPTLIDDTTFEVLVDNDMAANDFLAVKADIEAYIRQQLRNGKVTMSVRVSEAKEVIRAYSPVEKYQLLSERNPALIQLKEDFGLELA
jgi:DNA polymerase-3 subunit gamma/tau